MDARIANFESNQFSTKNSVKILKENLEQNNSSVTCCMEMLDSLNKRVNTLEKVANESSNTDSSHTNDINNKCETLTGARLNQS